MRVGLRRSLARLAFLLGVLFSPLADAQGEQPSIGAITPLPPSRELDGRAYFPLEPWRNPRWLDGRGRQAGVDYLPIEVRLANGREIPDAVLRRAWALDADGTEHELSGQAYMFDGDRGVVSLGDAVALDDPDGPPSDGPSHRVDTNEGIVVFPRKLASGTRWRADGVERKLVGTTSVAVRAGRFADCVVIDCVRDQSSTGGEMWREVYCADVGKVLELDPADAVSAPCLRLEKLAIPHPIP